MDATQLDNRSITIEDHAPNWLISRQYIHQAIDITQPDYCEFYLQLNFFLNELSYLQKHTHLINDINKTPHGEQCNGYYTKVSGHNVSKQNTSSEH
jgi:hypothetical protein